MIITPNFHLGFVARDVEKSTWWYKTFLNMHEKFTLYWGDLLPKNEEHRSRMPAERLEMLEQRKDEKWITYLEFDDCPGTFVELFNMPTAHVHHLPNQEVDFGYTHYGHTVDDVQAFYESVLAKGGEEYVIFPPRPNIDRTKSLWLKDPDGNEMEFIQYSEYAMPLIGRDLPEGVDFAEIMSKLGGGPKK